MFLATHLYEALNARYLDVWEQDRYSSLRADLEIFVTGLPFTNSYLKQLRPSQKGVCEIRSKLPRPSIRVFGCFASRDVFIATNYQLRSKLGRFNSIEWKEASRLARHEFRALLGADPAVGELHELATGVIYV